MTHLLALLVIPFVGALLLGVLSIFSNVRFKLIAFFISLIPLLILSFSKDHLMGSELTYPWLPSLSIDLKLGVDPVTWLFLLLVSIILPITILVTNEAVSLPSFFYALILILQGFLIGFFTAKNLAVFTFFWEAMILPLYFLLAFYGKGENRSPISMKFLIYMAAGSSLMVAAVLALYFEGDFTFDMARLIEIAPYTPHASAIFAIFLVAFAVKTPLFPFHAWLPDTYFQAPTAGTILLSSLLSKAGIYGIWRIGIEMFPTFLEAWSPFLLPFAIGGAFYGAFAAWSESDYKRLIAYVSLSHVNFILAGLFIWNFTAHAGALLQAFNHGVTIGALFLVIGWLEERLGTTSMAATGGLTATLPLLAWLTLFFALASIALPGTNNFIGELILLFGLFMENPWVGSLLGLTTIFSAIYTLRFIQRVYFGPRVTPNFRDISYREFAIASPLIAAILIVGIFPSSLLDKLPPPLIYPKNLKNWHFGNL